MASGSGPDRISMCPVRLRAVLLCSCVRRHTYRLALKLLHLEVWRQTDTKAPPPIPPTATCLTAQPGVPETAVCKAPPACMVPLGPRHDGLCWETPPGAHVAQRPPDGPRWEAVAPMNMGQLIRQDEEIRRDWPAWPQGATSAHIEGVGQVFRGVHGDTPSESSGDDHLPGLPDDGQPVNHLLFDRSAAGAIACRREQADRLHKEDRDDRERREKAASRR